MEAEGKVDSFGTGELKKRIRNLLKQVLGITKISDDLIEEVMFLSESESEKKSEQEKKDSSNDNEKSIHNSDVKDGESDDIVYHSDGKESKPEAEEFDENKDIMLFMDDNDIENIEDMQDSERLQLFDKVNRLTKFPGYQPKQKESLLEIVIKSVGLMRLLKQNKKLVDSEVEEAEDLIKDIRAERTWQKWIKESTEKKLVVLIQKKKIKLLMRVQGKRVMFRVQKPLMLYQVQALLRLLLKIQLQLQ